MNTTKRLIGFKMNNTSKENRNWRNRKSRASSNLSKVRKQKKTPDQIKFGTFEGNRLKNKSFLNLHL